MTSLPSVFTVGSASSVRSARDAIASYRRAQYFVAGSAVALASDTSDYEEDDEEASFGSFRPRLTEAETLDEDLAPILHHDSIEQFAWNDDAETSERHPPVSSYRLRQNSILSFSVASRDDRHRPAPVSEDTPLLRKAVSFSTPPCPSQHPVTLLLVKDHVTAYTPEQVSYPASSPTLQRRSSSTSVTSVKHVGRSTFGQTLFNSIAILLGIGMLSEPLAFAYAGWVTGTALILSYGFITCYTAKILARVILSDPRVRSYADIGRKAFGPRSTGLIGIIFCFELFSISVILVTLYADSLHSIIPQYSANTYKLWGTILLVPTVFLPLSLLSYTSILGIISTVLVIFVIFVDGFSKPEAPGSLWSPAETGMGIEGWDKLGIAFGLFMAGFSGHAVIPSLARDMTDPSQFDKMINWAFVVATLIYTLIGYAGYRMFGTDVSDEVSVDLLKTPGYNHVLNQAALWMLVISPLSKFALTTQPLNAMIEILLGIGPPLTAPEEISVKSNGLTIAPQGSHVALKRVLAVFQRVFFTLLAVAVSIVIPEFSSMMAIVGAFAAFMLCVIGPILAKVMLDGRCGVFDGTILFVGTIMAVWGTVSACLS